jgi:uncharacterized protein DUF6496
VFHRIDETRVEMENVWLSSILVEIGAKRVGRRSAETFPTAVEATALAKYQGEEMARYGKAAAKSVKSAMHREKRGTLKSGKGGKGGTVTSRKQAIAIGLSEARKRGAKVPRRKAS